MSALSRRSALVRLFGMPLLCRSAMSASERGKHLLLDPRVVGRTEGVRLALGPVVKDSANPLFGEDRLWEVRYDNLYANVLFDESERLFKCWYSPFIVDEVTSAVLRERWLSVPYKPGKREMGVCYAVSEDGIHWSKPDLGLIDFNGSRHNNLVARGPHGAGLCCDMHDADPRRRYKMFYRALRQMEGMFSADGLRWSAPVAFEKIQAQGDTHNNAFWAKELNRYVGITRLWHRERHQRLVGRTESPDFRNWTKAVEVLTALDTEPYRQTYAMPVFPYGSLYLGLLMMFNTDTDTVDCELARSLDTVRWERVCPGTPLIPRGPQAHDSSCIYAAAHPVVLRDEIRVYYGASNGTHTGWRDGFFCLARLRPDGFAGIETGDGTSGIVITNRLCCAGRELCVTADVNQGLIRAGVVGAPELAIGRCRPITRSATDAPLRWSGADLGPLHGKQIQIVFELRSAKLYSFRFGQVT